MKKTDFVKEIQKKNGFTAKEAAHAVDLVFDTIIEKLKEGESVKITGFGTFNVKDVKARTGRVPGQKETYETEAHKAPTFKYSDTVKNQIKY